MLLYYRKQSRKNIHVHIKQQSKEVWISVALIGPKLKMIFFFSSVYVFGPLFFAVIFHLLLHPWLPPAELHCIPHLRTAVLDRNTKCLHCCGTCWFVYAVSLFLLHYCSTICATCFPFGLFHTLIWLNHFVEGSKDELQTEKEPADVFQSDFFVYQVNTFVIILMRHELM